MTPTRALINAAATVLLSAVFAALAIAVGMSMQTTTAHAMTTTETVTTTTTDYADGAAAQTADDADWSADTASDEECGGVAMWQEMVNLLGLDAATEYWDELIGWGWTNPANGDATILVQPGC